MKRKTAFAAATLLMIFALSGCSMSEPEVYTIGISQFAEHGALDDCKEGFMEGLASEGIVDGDTLEVQYRNAHADIGTGSQIAESLVASDVDLIAAIGTPAAQSVCNAAKDTEIPVVYAAVSDPENAGFVNGDGTGTGNITGSSFKLPADRQLELIRSTMPDAGRIGIIYNISETNSLSMLAEYEKLAPEYGFQIISTGINSIADVEMAAGNMVIQVDCICNLTDNTVVEELQILLDKANSQSIPVFGSEADQVRHGCVAAMSIDYYSLGYDTGIMAAKILKGEAAVQETESISSSEAKLYINKAAADKIGFAIDGTVMEKAEKVFEEIAE